MADRMAKIPIKSKIKSKKCEKNDYIESNWIWFVYLGLFLLD